MLVLSPIVFVVASVMVVGLLRFVAPPTSAFMLRDRVIALFDNPGGRELEHAWIAWTDISPQAPLAAIAAEDQRFTTHHGFDLEAMRDAWTDYRAGEPLRGASTISQQVAKNLFLWPGRSYLRKALEAYFTLLIEALWPKRRILEVYLNVAQYGERLYGIAAASQRYFGKSPAELNASESALLAAVLPNPIRLNASRPSRYVRERQRWILAQMRQLGGPDSLKAIAWAR